MSIYVFLYFSVIFSLLFIWIKFLKQNYKFTYSKLFFLSMFFYSTWLLFYILSFSTTYNKDVLLVFSRLLYWLSFLSIYTILLFIKNYWNRKIKIFQWKFNKWFIAFIIIFFYLILFSDLIIKDMFYDEKLKYHYELLWPLYYVYIFFSFIYFPLFLRFWFKNLFSLNKINKIRFSYIFSAFWILLFNLILFLAILPFFWFWILEKEQILFFIPYLLIVFYTIHKYHFTNIKIIIWKIYTFLISIIISGSLISFLKYYFLSIDKRLIGFWWISKTFWVIDLFVGIGIFLILYNYLSKFFLKNTELNKFKLEFTKLKSKIPFIMTLDKLNDFLLIKFEKLFKISYVNIRVFQRKADRLELYNYFNKDSSRDVFINDIVFIEENKYKFDKKKLKHQLKKKSNLILPLINNKREIIWFFEIWHKPFKDQYFSEEIETIKDFVWYLVWHIRYMKIYHKMNELSINLDKKVDEKTLRYNSLLSRQREFISMSSHEIKTPVWSAIFQIDSIIDDFNEWEIPKEKLEKELNILNKQLLKVWDLVNKIFTVEKYDLKNIKLFIEKIDLNILFENEIDRYKEENKKIKISLDIDEKIWYIEIDKVQFTQIIDNLIYNSIKYSNNKNLEISIKCIRKIEKVIITIEDNWDWLNTNDINNIFWKYFTWELSSVWIWMWLYLCKKIVTMHYWTIEAENSKKLWWAKFTITIPKKHKLYK